MRSPIVLRKLRSPTQTEAIFIGSILSAIVFCTLIGKESVPHKVSRTNEIARVKPFVPFPIDVSQPLEPLTVTDTRKNTDADNQHEATDAAAEVEALAALRAAEEVRLRGNSEKAFKLLRRAAALAPKQADVLTRLGEFLEEAQRDVLAADLLYARALTTVPDHPVALAHRRRTADLVENIDRDTLHKIELKRDALSAIPDSHAALRRAKKEAYYQHVYHTVGIEGNTMSLQQTRSILETKLAVAGKSIDEHNEILGLDAAMKFINSTLIHRMGEITVQDILEIHRRVLGYVDPTEGGFFRRTQVYVGGHIPPGPMFINVLMDQFLKWLNSDDALDMHPVRLAALAHYKLVHIHPFTDGNGRTSRLLMNLILMQAGYPPVIILKQHRHLYYQHLQTANEGDVRPFVRFIAECTERTLDLYLWATSEFSHQVPALAQPAILSAETSFEDEIS